MENNEEILSKQREEDHYLEMDVSDDHGYTESERFDPPSGHVQELPTEMWGMPAKFDIDSAHNGTKISSDIVLDFCGYQKCHPRHRYGPISRTVYTIHVVLEGHGTLEIGSRHYTITKNQAFLIPPDVEVLYYADEEDPWRYCWVGFHGDFSEKIVKRIGLSKDSPVVDMEDVNLVEHLIKNTMKYFEINIHDQLMRTGLLCTILAHLVSLTKAKDLNLTALDEGIAYDEYAIRYMRRNFSQKIKISELADKIGISRSYLNAIIKERTGLSPQEYLLKIRMNHASHALLYTNDPIQVISKNCGYEDALAFSKIFHKHFHMSPSQYRKEAVKGKQ